MGMVIAGSDWGSIRHWRYVTSRRIRDNIFSMMYSRLDYEKRLKVEEKIVPSNRWLLIPNKANTRRLRT
jgi:hypothetical protein